ncbi:hypothetical protein GIB67_034315 [Kingdonia uniflora]|uniref:Uncharacterized protein n=1 Tax=Kingdonia uniflora TaxID=39325 RepID=A0A7J7NS50_9MAGN|nr:hypothetical protein GIB67_034315 [Kingdonia uniflora]
MDALSLGVPSTLSKELSCANPDLSLDNDPVDVISDNESAEQSSSSTKDLSKAQLLNIYLEAGKCYGRVKPNIVAYGQEIMGSKISTGCKSLSGTSVASPSSCSVKQALVEGVAKLSCPNMYEQGAGRVDLLESYEILKRYRSRASIFPSILDYTDHPYSWPFSYQLLYAGTMPVMFNATILNGMGLIGYVEGQPTWHPSNDEENLLSIHFYSKIIWPWIGYLALHMQIKDEAKGGSNSAKSKKDTMGSISQYQISPRYIPRDSLEVRNDILDWHGDYMHINFLIMFNMLRNSGYYVETLGSPLTCFDARRYGTLLMVDLEDEYFEEEIEKLRDDILNAGLGLVVFIKWYNVDTMEKMRFYDDNTRSW